MKKVFLPICLLLLLFSPTLHSQPYHIDKSKPEPKALVLFDDPENEGVKLGSFEGELAGDAQRFFIKDYSEYQPVDIFLISQTEGRELELNLVLATWNDNQQTCNTGSQGYCQIKFRNYGGVGLDIKGEAGTEYTLIAVVGKEVLPDFDSPFYKVSENDLGKLPKSSVETAEEASEGDSEAKENNGGGSNNLILYVIAFFLFLIVILLGVFVLRKNKPTLILFLATSFAFGAYGQDPDSRDESEAERDERLMEEIKEEVRGEYTRFEEATKRVGHVTGVLKKIEELRKAKKDYDDFSSAYEGLGACIARSPAFKSPRIPSFCDYDYSTGASGVGSGGESCASCFLDARTRFNEVRFTLSRLETIYKCTKKMTKAAKAFGDSFSTATKSGLGWDGARRDIEASEARLEKAYDEKYADLMRKLNASLIDMSVCEAQYGLEDWYDRFGFVYYEFMSDRYKRSD